MPLSWMDTDIIQGLSITHLNMGWEGNQDAWYNFYAEMPDGYITVYETVYNIFISDAAEIISGRVIDAFGNPLVGETVTAQKSTGEIYQAVTNGQGIYAIPNVPSASAYTVSVSNTSYSFNDRMVNTGTSVDSSALCGNVWAVDFVPFGGSGTNYYVDTQREPAIMTGPTGRMRSIICRMHWPSPQAETGSSLPEGTYKPDQSTADPNGSGDQNATFQLLSGVEIYGGFPAGGTNLWADRNAQGL